MAALTKDRSTPYKALGTMRHRRTGVAAATKCFKGGIAAKNAAGFLVPATDAIGVTVVGIFEETVDNSAGANGDLSATYVTGVEAELENAAGAVVQAAQKCYVVDDQSVMTAAVAVKDASVGTVAAFTAAKVWVYIDETVSVTGA